MKNYCITCQGNFCEEHKGQCPEGHHAELPEEYRDELMQRVFRASSNVEREGYLQWPRIREIMEFSKRMGYRHLGIAFCVGLKQEVKKITEIFEKNGFQVTIAMCKMDGHDKSRMGLSDQEKFDPDYDPMCNPIRQAKYLEEQGTDFNVVVGLCVGHDSMFYKYTNTLTTTLVTKDRVLGHNPVAAVYLYDGYLGSKVDME